MSKQMAVVEYQFFKEADEWVMQLVPLTQDYKVSKENMTGHLYDMFEKILPQESKAGLERVRAKLPGYLQFESQRVDTGIFDVTVEIGLELYIRRHKIDQVSAIIKDVDGQPAKIPVRRFSLFMDYNPNLVDALD